ncbi:hypothetical protein FACS189419_00260 [Planctomycetales bacterium]|nr:hypothetical protein FACS189419_00260 [Planctomycetales bacterium]
MANWYYFNKSGDKVGPIRGRELKQLALDGTVTQDTLIENEEGKQGKAGNVKGLIFPALSTPQSAIVPPVEPNPFTGTMPAVDNPFIAAVPEVSQSYQSLNLTKPIIISGIIGGILFILIIVIGGWLMLSSYPRFTVAEQEKIDEFCEKYGTDVKAVISLYGQDGISLHIAANNGNVAVVKYLVSKGADVNAKTESGGTLLHVAAAWNENVEVAKYLVSKGADVNAKTESGFTPLHAAIQNENVEVAKYLVSKGADVNAKTELGETLLHTAAAWNKNVEVTKYLVSKGADVNAKTELGETPLDIAKRKGVKNRAFIEYLGGLTKK